MTTVPWQGRSPSAKARLLAWLLLLLPLLVVAALSHRPGLSARCLAAAAHLRSARHGMDCQLRCASGRCARHNLRVQGQVDSGPRLHAERRQLCAGDRGGARHARSRHQRAAPGELRALAGGQRLLRDDTAGSGNRRLSRARPNRPTSSARQRRASRKNFTRPEGGYAGPQLLGRTGAAGSQRSAILAVDRVGSHRRRVLRSGACSALLRHRRSRSSRMDRSSILRPTNTGRSSSSMTNCQDFFAPQDAQSAHEAIRLLLSGNDKGFEALAETLTPAGQEIMQRIYHKQREYFAPALLAEVDKRRRATRGRISRGSSPVSFACRCCCCTAPTTRSFRRPNCCGCNAISPRTNYSTL